MAGYRENFGGNLDYAHRGTRDIGNRLQQSAQSAMGGGKGASDFAGAALKTSAGIKKAREEVSKLKKDMETIDTSTEVGEKKFAALSAELVTAQKRAAALKKELKGLPLDALEKGFGKVTKGIFSMNASILTIGFDFLIDSIKRVYELQEKWTKAMGGFNMKIGGMTKGLAGAQKAAGAWSSTIRGLTGGDIEEGIGMFNDFTDALGETVKKGDEFETFGLQLARGFNLGGGGAGKLTKTFEVLGDSGDTAAETMKSMVTAANQAGVPVNMIAKDLEESATYMARFGKEGEKTFVQGAAWVRKYKISMEQLKGAVEGFDMFDEAVKTSSKLNTMFHTMINGMDLMLQDDPAKRIDMIRQSFLDQGLTYDKMVPKQRRALAEQLKLSDEQVAALFDQKNAGESYADFQEKADKREKAELSAKQIMQKQLQATAQTMYAFGMAFDRVTTAIGKAIKPLLVVFGLAKDGDKDFGSFGEKMESITVTVEKFFESLARNQKWNKFMVTLATDLKKAAGALKDFVMDGRAADLMGDIADGMKSFYTTVRDIGIALAPAFKPLMTVFQFLTKHIEALAAAWAGMKILNAGANMKNNIGDLFGKGAEGAADKIGAGGGKFGKGAAGALGGLATGAAMGGAGAMAGGAIGGAIGAFIPFIGPLMGPLGAALGKGIEELFSSTKVKSHLEVALDELATSQKKLSTSTNELEAAQQLNASKRSASDATNSQADKVLLSLKNDKIKLDGDEKALAITRLEQLQKFGDKTGDVAQALQVLKGDGKLTSSMFAAISKSQTTYKETVESLDAVSNALLNDEKTKQEFANLDVQKKALELQKVKDERTLGDLAEKRAKAEKEAGEQYDKTHKRDLSTLGGAAGAALSGVMGGGTKEAAEKMLAIANAGNSFAQEEARIRTKQADTGKVQIDTQIKLQEKQLAEATKLAILNTDEYRQYAANAKASGIKTDLATFSSLMKPELAKATGRTVEEIQNAFENSVPKTATGGVVTRPQVRLVGEAGPEAIIPLSKTNLMNKSGGGGNGDIQIVTQIADINIDGRKVGAALVKSVITSRQ